MRLFRLLLGLPARFFLFLSAAGLLLGPEPGLRGGAFLLLAAAVGFGERAAAARLVVGLARVLQDAHAGRVLLGRQRAGSAGRASGRPTPGGRRRGRLRARGGLGAGIGWGGGRLAAAGFRRTGRHDALLANLDRHRLRAAMREALAHLAALDRAAQPQCAAGTQRQTLLLVLVGVMFVRFSHALRYRPSLSRRSFRLQLVIDCRRFIGAGSGNAQPGQLLEIEKQPPTQFSAAHGGVHDPVAAKGRAKLGSGQGLGARQIPRQLRQLSPPAGRAVPGAQ